MDSCLHHGGTVRSIQGQLQVGDGGGLDGFKLVLNVGTIYSQS